MVAPGDGRFRQLASGIVAGSFTRRLLAFCSGTTRLVAQARYAV
jgi:hypothetical protein